MVLCVLTREAMRAGALLGIIDRNGKGARTRQRGGYQRGRRAGFALVNQYDFVKPDNLDYFLVFRTSDFGP